MGSASFLSMLNCKSFHNNMHSINFHLTDATYHMIWPDLLRLNLYMTTSGAFVEKQLAI